MLKDVRLAFPVLNTPEEFQGDGRPKFSATMLMEKNSENVEAINKAIRQAAKDKWGEKAPGILKSLMAGNKTAFYDGDIKAEYAGFEGNMALNASAQANAAPRLLDGARNELPRDTGILYAGCYANVAVEIWAQDNQWGRRINANLRGVQFVRDGDAFGSGAPADLDEFEEIENANDDLSWDDEDDFA